MSAIPTTFDSSTGEIAAIVPRLTDREAAGLWEAIQRGDLVGIIDQSGPRFTPGRGELVGALTPTAADAYVRRADADAVDRIYNRLREALDEMTALKVIIGEVMAESRPQDFDYRLHDAAEDVQRALDAAIDASEDL